MSSISLSALRRASASFEVRFDEAYALWDISGQIALRLKEIFIDLQLQAANPGAISFLADGIYSVNVTLNNAVIMDYSGETNPEKASKLPALVIDMVLSTLDVAVIKRAGVRFAFSKQFEAAADSHALMSSLGLMVLPREGIFKIQPTNVDPTYRVEIDDGDSGYTVTIGTTSKLLSFKPPAGMERWIGTTNKTIHEFVVDIDLFTKHPVDIGSFNARQWLQSSQKRLNTDFDKLFELGA